MLPPIARTRRVPRIESDAEGREISRTTDDVPATYGWKSTDKRTGEVTWINADDERTDPVLRRLFAREEDTPITHTLEKVGADGATRYGPVDI